MAAENTDKATAQLTAESGSVEPIAGSSMTAAANSSTRFFDFFALPRELRDKIYEQPVLFEYEHLPTDSEHDLIFKAKKLRTSLLRVSRQFRDEYAERCTGQQVLCMRDHCETRAVDAVLPSPNRAPFWAVEFFVMCESTDDDLEVLQGFLNLRAGQDLALRSIKIKLLFENTPREEIESGPVRNAISDFQACEKVACLEIYLVEELWNYKGSGKPRFLIARWDRSDDMNINFLTPAAEVCDMGSEWGHPIDTKMVCCDHSDNNEDEGKASGGKADGEDGNEGGN